LMKLAFVVTFCALILRISCALPQDKVGGTFTVNCVPVSQQRSDPIVQPGMPSQHVHAISGGNAFKREMGPLDAYNATATTCDKAIDHSNYWVPQMYHYRTSDKMWEMVPFQGNAVYYQLRACNYNPAIRACPADNLPMAFPDGFRMVAGDPMRRSYNASDKAQRAVHTVCLGPGGQFPGFPPYPCDRMRAEVYFPSCWDGKNLDSPDHKSHMAYPEIGDYNGGVCPQSHPVALFSIFFEFFFDTSKIKDTKLAFANGDATGYGFHGDFLMGWTNRALLQTAHHDCVGPSDCPKLGNQHSAPRDLIYPAHFEEDIGLTGPIPALPGDNPVVWPPAPFQ